LRYVCHQISRIRSIPFVRPQLPSGARNYITREGANRFRHRLNELLAKRRGNEPSSAAKPDDQRLESDIRRLQSILDSVAVAEIPADQEKVAFGASVSIRHGSGEEEEYQIVGADEAAPEVGRISWISPLARALLSRRAGDKVRFKAPAGVEELTILKVHYQGN
jgi:transcription elongation factor GreB